MRLHLVAVGRVRDAALREICSRYAERLRHHVPLEIREVRDAGRPDRDAERALSEEAEALLRAVPRGSRLVALTRTGRALSSDELARLLEGWRQDARDVTLVLGGAHGIAPSLLERAELKLSLSRFTLPHDLARAVLLEQLYRAATILRGEPYHKGARR